MIGFSSLSNICLNVMFPENHSSFFIELSMIYFLEMDDRNMAVVLYRDWVKKYYNGPKNQY